MATTFVEYTGDGNATKQFTFPSYQGSDVKVRVDGVLKTNPTHYIITNYTTTGGGNVVFTSGNIPSSPANIRIYRDTNVDTAKATFTAGSSVKAADLNNNTTQLLYRAQEEQIPNLIHSYDIDDGAITADKIAADAVTSAKLADNSVDSEHYVDGSIDTVHIANDAITTGKLAPNSVNTGDIANFAVTGGKLANDTIENAKIQANAVATVNIQNSAITTAKIADSNVTTAKIADANVTENKLASGAVTNTKIANNSLDEHHYQDGSIKTEHITDGNITTAKIADSGVTTAKIADGNITTAKIANDAVTADKLAHTSVSAGSYTAADITVDAQGRLTSAASGTIATSEIADSAITSAKIASNAVTTDKIADSELSTLAGMQSTTASNLASSTALTATTAELNQLDGITLETSVTTNSDTRIPTSKAVNDLVLSVTNALGGFVAIANETSFPTSNPDPSNNAGTVVSISQLSTGLAVNGSGVATISNGAGSGNTVTITGFPANLQSQTLPASSGLQVQTTSTLHTYTFHKQLASAADIQAISATVNSFSNRYRVSASAPTSSLDGGDLWYDTTNSKLMVYSSQNSAWEESSAIGNFFISTISSSSNTGGGSATPNGTAYRFTISDAPTTAAACIVSVDGVIQKPNSGSSQPSEGFVLVGNDIIFGAAPANGASLFVTVIGSTVGIGTPSNNTVTTAILQNGSVTTAKIVDSNVTTAKIADDAITAAKIGSGVVGASELGTGAVTEVKIASGAVTQNKIGADAVNSGQIADGAVITAAIADDAVTAAKLANTSVTAGSYGSSTSIPSITVDAQGRITAASGNTVNTDLVGDTSPQLGGTLLTNGHNIDFADTEKARFGNGADLQIHHTSGQNYVEVVGDGNLNLTSATSVVIKTATNKDAVVCNNGGSTDLYHNNSKKFETVTGGVTVTGDVTVTNDVIIPGSGEFYGYDNSKLVLGHGRDLQIYHDGTASYIAADDLRITNKAVSETLAKFIANGAVELYYNDTKKFGTTSQGGTITGTLTTTAGAIINGVTTIEADSDERLRIEVPSNNGDDWNYISYYGRDGNRDGFIGTWSDGTMTVYSDASGGHFIKFHSGSIEFNNHLLPNANNSFDLGSSNSRWRNIYTNDLNLSNEGSSNDVDGSWGDWTIQEGESDLFLKNNRSGKKYKFNLTEVS